MQPSTDYLKATIYRPPLHEVLLQYILSDFPYELEMAEQKIQRTKIIIVGAGFGGLGMAIALKESGEEDFLVLEKFSDVGGVWRDNRYPGCTCDVPSHLYSFSFAPYTSLRTRYPSQQNILRYLEGVGENQAQYQGLESLLSTR